MGWKYGVGAIGVWSVVGAGVAGVMGDVSGLVVASAAAALSFAFLGYLTTLIDCPYCERPLTRETRQLRNETWVCGLCAIDLDQSARATFLADVTERKTDG